MQVQDNIPIALLKIIAQNCFSCIKLVKVIKCVLHNSQYQKYFKSHYKIVNWFESSILIKFSHVQHFKILLTMKILLSQQIQCHLCFQGIKLFWCSSSRSYYNLKPGRQHAVSIQLVSISLNTQAILLLHRIFFPP